MKPWEIAQQQKQEQESKANLKPWEILQEQQKQKIVQADVETAAANQAKEDQDLQWKRHPAITDEWKEEQDRNALGVEQPWFDLTEIIGGAGAVKFVTKSAFKALVSILPDTVGSIAAGGMLEEVERPEGVGATVGAMGVHVGVGLLTGKVLDSVATVASKNTSVKSIDEVYTAVASDLKASGITNPEKASREQIQTLLKDNKITEADLVSRINTAPKNTQADIPTVAKDADQETAAWQGFIEDNRRQSVIDGKSTETSMPANKLDGARDRFFESKKMSDEGIATDIPEGRVKGAGNMSRMVEPDDYKKVAIEASQDPEFKLKYEAEGGAYRGLSEIKDGATRIVKQLSDDTGLNLQKWINEFQGHTEKLAEFSTAARIMAQKMAQEVDDLAGRALSTYADDLDMVKFIAGHTEYMNFKASLEAGRSNIGRALKAQDISVKGSGTDTPSFLEMDRARFDFDSTAQAQAEATIRAAGGKDQLIKIAKQMRAAKTDKAKLKLMNQQRTKLQGVLDYARASMLTSPKTISVNFIGNLTRPIMDNITDYSTAVFMMGRKTADKMTAREAAYRSQILASSYASELFVKPFQALMSAPGKVNQNNFLSALSEVVSGKGIRNAEMKLQRTGVIQDYKEGVYIPRTVDKDGNLIDADENIFQKVGRELSAFQRLASFGLMKATDNPFTKIAYDTELRGLLYRQSRGEGLSHADAIKVAETKALAVNNYREGVNQAVAQGKTTIVNPKNLTPQQLKEVQNLNSKAEEYARAVTWRDDSSWDMLEKFSNSNHVASQLLKITHFPFIKTPANLTSYALRHTPLAFVSGRWRKAVRGELGEVAQAKAWAQVATGSVALGSVYSMVDQGWITGSFNHRERELMEEAGIPENSIKIGDTWYDYSRLEPLGTMLSIAVNLRYAVDGLDDSDDLNAAEKLQTILFNAAGSIGSSIYNKTFLTGLGDIMRLIDTQGDAEAKEEAMQKWAANQGAKFVPMSSGLRFVAQMDQDKPYKYTSDTVVDNLLQRFGVGKDIIEHDSILGEEIIRPSTIFGFRKLDDNGSVAIKTMVALNMNIGRWKPSIQGVALPVREVEKVKQNLAKLGVREELETIVTSERFMRMPPSIQKTTLAQIISSFREQALGMYMKENKGVTEKAVDKFKLGLEGQMKEESIKEFDNAFDLIKTRKQSQNAPGLKLLEEEL